MAKFNFKSSGVKVEEIRNRNITLNEQIINPIQKIGIKTPLESNNSDVFKMHINIVDQITDNLKNLILTNNGERLAFYNYGANLRELLTEYNSEIQDDFNNIVENRIINAVSIWMPFININKIIINAEKNTINGLAVIALKISYTITGIDNIERELKVRLFVI